MREEFSLPAILVSSVLANVLVAAAAPRTGRPRRVRARRTQEHP